MSGESRPAPAGCRWCRSRPGRDGSRARITAARRADRWDVRIAGCSSAPEQSRVGTVARTHIAADGVRLTQSYHPDSEDVTLCGRTGAVVSGSESTLLVAAQAGDTDAFAAV